jgi:hypothetical protein
VSIFAVIDLYLQPNDSNFFVVGENIFMIRNQEYYKDVTGNLLGENT